MNLCFVLIAEPRSHGLLFYRLLEKAVNIDLIKDKLASSVDFVDIHVGWIKVLGDFCPGNDLRQLLPAKYYESIFYVSFRACPANFGLVFRGFF